MHARTQIYPLLTSSIQYKAPLCSCSPIFRGEVFDNVFPINCCISSVGQFSTKGEIIQFSRNPPLAWITLWALTSRDSAHLLFNSNENSFINLKLCSPEKWLICSKPGFLLIQATEAWSADGGRRGKTWEYPKCQIRWLFSRWPFDFIAWKSKI